ncbi:hypothetical protein F5Y17DRAFT_363882 [Xylariaceae sp. FL0594]|nr:hypothetical protein F5Y17DRAFT_363882 [Xylariaceae sp. FL0594]
MVLFSRYRPLPGTWASRTCNLAKIGRIHTCFLHQPYLPTELFYTYTTPPLYSTWKMEPCIGEFEKKKNKGMALAVICRGISYKARNSAWLAFLPCISLPASGKNTYSQRRGGGALEGQQRSKGKKTPVSHLIYRQLSALVSYHFSENYLQEAYACSRSARFVSLFLFIKNFIFPYLALCVRTHPCFFSPCLGPSCYLCYTTKSFCDQRCFSHGVCVTGSQLGSIGEKTLPT